MLPPDDEYDRVSLLLFQVHQEETSHRDPFVLCLTSPFCLRDAEIGQVGIA